MSKTETQSAIHGTDPSNLFPVLGLLQYVRLPYAPSLRDFGTLCPDSDILALHTNSRRNQSGTQIFPLSTFPPRR
jgi:hypothetical protein